MSTVSTCPRAEHALPLYFLGDVVREVLHAPYPGRRLTDDEIRARLRECEMCGVEDPSEPLVAMIHATRGRIAAHQDCGEARGYVLEIPAEPGVQLALGNLSPAGGSARFSTVGEGDGSGVAQPSRSDAVGALDAARSASQRGPGRGAAPADDDATGTDVAPVVSVPAPAHCLTCPRCTSSNVADLGGYAECRECGYGFAL